MERVIPWMKIKVCPFFIEESNFQKISANIEENSIGCKKLWGCTYFRRRDMAHLSWKYILSVPEDLCWDA